LNGKQENREAQLKYKSHPPGLILSKYFWLVVAENNYIQSSSASVFCSRSSSADRPHLTKEIDWLTPSGKLKLFLVFY